MSLRTLELPLLLNTSDHDLFRDFFVPALTHAFRYDRGVGYFASGWLRLAAQGMVRFAAQGGRARWVTSPILNQQDWEALLAGDEARLDPELHEVLRRNVLDLERTLEEDTLSALAWMIADGVLSFKLALPRGKLDDGDFHDKFGVFTDLEGDQVSFNGSYNDSIQGTRNYESIKVFKSWEPTFAPLVKAEQERFDRLWCNLDPNVRVFDIPEITESMLRLRTGERPYPPPPWMKFAKSAGEQSLPLIWQRTEPSVPTAISLRGYQLDAIEAWFQAGCRGLFEMATGTGKTITALASAVRLYARERRLVLVIACPYQHLVDQWYDEATSFGFRPIRAYQSREKWLDKLNDKITGFNFGDSDVLCVITTHDTFATEHFRKTIDRVKGSVLVIADEAHHLGAEHSRRYLPESAGYRLALSATPDRWFDDVGTQALRDYFGSTVFSFTLGDAIGVSLVHYYYYPVLVELNDDEMARYRQLSTKIGQLLAQGRDENDDQLTQLLLKRSRILNEAANKIPAVSALVDQQPEIRHTLFYCSPGQIDDVMQMIGIDKRISAHRFTAREDIPTRQDILRRFASGQLQALAAMHCLDEGVDVPSTETAYILASSSNPRQFIQRRGRVLRRSPGKEFAVIYDLITVPPPAVELDDLSASAERKILRRELRRFAEFADYALNKQAAYNVIWSLADQYGILDFQ